MKRTFTFSLLVLLLVPSAGHGQQPAFHGNPQRTGYSPVQGPTNVALKWRLDLKGAIISSPVIGSDGTVYLGSVLNDTKHPEHFITFVGSNGTVQSRLKTGYVDTQVLSSPAIGPDGKIFVGAQDGCLYALNPDGALAWRYQAKAPIQQHPVVAQDGTVYVGFDGKLHAFFPTGTLKWTADLVSTLAGGPSLSPDEATVYAFGYNPVGPTSTLYAFNRDGSLKWRYDGFYAYYPALSPPTVMADGTVLVLSGSIAALSPANGALRWTYSPSASYHNSYGALATTPAGEVIFAFDRFLGKLRSDGSLVWQQEFWGGVYGNEGEGTWCSPLVDARGNIYLGLGTGKRWTRDWGKVIRAYSATGGLLWEFGLGDGVYTSSPALGTDGALYLGAMDGFLYAFGNTDVTLVSLALSPASVTGGKTSTGTVRLSAPPAGDVSVMLSSSTHYAFSPASVIVPAGQVQASFSVGTMPIPFTAYATLSAARNGRTTSAALTIQPAVPAPLLSLSINPTNVTGGGSATCTVALDGLALPGGTPVTLTTSDPALAQVPPTVTVPSGAAATTFPVSTSRTNLSRTVTISAAWNGVTRTTTLTVIRPAPVLTIRLSNAHIVLSWPAYAAGARLQHSSNAAQWVTLANTPAIDAASQQFQVTLPTSAGDHFYRLFYP